MLSLSIRLGRKSVVLCIRTSWEYLWSRFPQGVLWGISDLDFRGTFLGGLWVHFILLVKGLGQLPGHNTAASHFNFMIHCLHFGVGMCKKCSFKRHYTFKFLKLLLRYWWIALSWLSVAFPLPPPRFSLPFPPVSSLTECVWPIQSSLGLLAGEVVWKCTTEVPYSLRMNRLVLYSTQLRFYSKAAFSSTLDLNACPEGK